jgi:small subunit ribosomal protein S1
LEGLIHISELSWGRVDDPAEVLQPAQDIEVYILNVDHDRGRVGLSLKRLQPDPWLMVDERYTVGQIVEGAVTHVVGFGAFVEVEEGLEGLIHVSELSPDKVDHPRDVVSEGDLVKVRVLNVDTERRRIGLSLRDIASSHSIYQDEAQ